MSTKKIISTIIAGLFVSLSVGCNNNQQTLNQDISQIQNNGVNSLASKSSNSKIKIASYNIRNLFDGVKDNPNNPGERAKPAKEQENLARAIKELDADVIAMQEVESKKTLNTFLNKYLKGHKYNVTLIEGNDARGIDVALLSKLPITGVKSHKDLKFYTNPDGQKVGFGRDLLKVDMKGPNNYPFSIFVAHLKSKHGEKKVSDARRKGEASKIREIVLAHQKANPNSNYMVIGDFNDTYKSDPLTPLLKNFPAEDIINTDLGAADYVYTYHPKTYRSRIDYMLVSPGMQKEYIRKSVEIHKIMDGGEDVKFTYFRASDHLPITAEFDISSDR